MEEPEPDPILDFPQSLETASEAVLSLSAAWGDTNPHRPLEQAVGELEAIKHLMSLLSLIESDLSVTVYDQVWSRFKSYEAEVNGTKIEVNRSTSTSADAELLLSRLVAKLADEFPYTALTTDGELVPPSAVVDSIVKRVSNVAGLHRPSHFWGKAKLKELGIDPESVLTTTRGRKLVRFIHSL